MTRRAEARGDEVATREVQAFRELEADEGILRTRSEAVSREADEAAAVARDEFRDAFRKQREAERMISAEEIEYEIVAIFLRIHAEAENLGAIEKFPVREGVELVNPQIAGLQVGRNFPRYRRGGLCGWLCIFR